LQPFGARAFNYRLSRDRRAIAAYDSPESPMADSQHSHYLAREMLGTGNIRVRPLKFAMLVDPNNASQVRDAIRLACSLWGGMFFPIIPMYGRMPASWRKGPLRAPPAKSVIEGYLSAFDPDMLVQIAAELPSYVTDSRLKVIKPQEVFGKQSRVERSPSYGIGATDLLWDIYKECFKYKLKYPVKVSVPRIPDKMGLFWASVFGEFAEPIAQALVSELDEALEIDRPLVTPQAFLDQFKPNVLFPRRITEWGLPNRRGLRFGRSSCIFFMDGSKIEDVIDYWNLRATGRTVIPWPKQFVLHDAFKQFVAEFCIEERRNAREDHSHFDVVAFVRSRNTTMEEMGAAGKSLALPPDPLGQQSGGYYTLQHWIPRIWDEWARGKDGGVAEIYCEEEVEIDINNAEDLEMNLKPLLPKFTDQRWFSSQALCANEFDLRLYGADEFLAEVYPKATGTHLVREISGLTGLGGGWRIGRRGLVNLVSRSSSEHRKVPSAESIFFAWLADHGWKAELSPPGVLVKQIFKRLNGFPRYVADKAVLGLLERMNGGAVHKNNEPMEGPGPGLSIDREVSVGELKKQLNGAGGRRGLYEEFISKGIFKLGLRTKCPNCQRNTWFPMEALRESMDCPKCLNSFPAAGNVESNSSWFYKTAGPFSVPNYADGAYAVLLTMDALCDMRLMSLRTTAVPSFTATASGKPALEADLAMFWRETTPGEEREGLLFGECKTFGVFAKRDVDRMRYLGSEFPGAVLVFSTLREALSKEELTPLRRLAKAGRKPWKAGRTLNPVLILTGTELLTWQRLPNCWTDSQQKQFQNVHDLESLCDATQQIHLGLPSVHEDRKERDQRRKRHAAQTPPNPKST
jgi:hypothetical protein